MCLPRFPPLHLKTHLCPGQPTSFHPRPGRRGRLDLQPQGSPATCPHHRQSPPTRLFTSCNPDWRLMKDWTTKPGQQQCCSALQPRMAQGRGWKGGCPPAHTDNSFQPQGTAQAHGAFESRLTAHIPLQQGQGQPHRAARAVTNPNLLTQSALMRTMRQAGSAVTAPAPAHF